MYFQERNVKNNSAGFVWPNLCTNTTSRLTMHNVLCGCEIPKSPRLSMCDIFKKGNTFNRQHHIIVSVHLLKLVLKVLIPYFIEKRLIQMLSFRRQFFLFKTWFRKCHIVWMTTGYIFRLMCYFGELWLIVNWFGALFFLCVLFSRPC